MLVGLLTAVVDGCSGYDSHRADTATLPALVIPTTAAASRVMMIGDSITDESRAQLVQAIPGLAIDALAGRTVGHHWLSDTALEHLPDLTAATRPDWWVVALGTNDGNFARHPLDEMRSDIAALLDGLGRDSCVLWVLPFVVEPAEPLGIERTNDFALIAADEVSRLSCHATLQWSESVLTTPGLIGPDGVHPTTAGRQRFAMAISTALVAAREAATVGG